MLASKPKRLLSLLLVLVMLLGLVPTGVFAAEPTDTEKQEWMQIVEPGGVTYYTADGTEGSEGDYAVKLTKTVNPTGIENRFTINLEVETKQNIQELKAAPDAAVVLVFDASGSMGAESTQAAKDAANRFLETYVEGAGDAQRKVALVEFGTIAQTMMNWTEANAGGTVSDAVQAGMDKIETPPMTYYACYETGEHECTNTVAYCTEYSPVWSIVDGMRICTVCGYQTNSRTGMPHYHCISCPASLPAQGADILARSRFAEDHQHPGTYVGPHSPVFDGAGYLNMDGSIKDGTGGLDPQTNLRGGLMLARNLLIAGQQEGGYQPRQGGYNRGGYQRNQYGQPRPGGYNRQGGYRQRTPDYDPNAKYSLKKRIEYKEQNIDPTVPVRLNKFLANAGVCSRREADEFIQAGVVTVNGKVVTELGRVINEKKDKFICFREIAG